MRNLRTLTTLSVSLLVFFCTSAVFAMPVPGTFSIKAMTSAIHAEIPPLRDLISAEKISSEHGVEGGTYHVKFKNDKNTLCISEVRVTADNRPGDPIGSIRFKAEVISTDCSSFLND